jgi:hypothetical protein
MDRETTADLRMNEVSPADDEPVLKRNNFAGHRTMGAGILSYRSRVDFIAATKGAWPRNGGAERENA